MSQKIKEAAGRRAQRCGAGAQRQAGDLGRAGELTYGVIPELERQIADGDDKSAANALPCARR